MQIGSFAYLVGNSCTRARTLTFYEYKLGHPTNFIVIFNVILRNTASSACCAATSFGGAGGRRYVPVLQVWGGRTAGRAATEDEVSLAGGR